MEFYWYIFIVSCVAVYPVLEARLDECFDVGGLLVPVYTPVDDNGDIAFDVIGQYAQYLHGYGINGVVVAATAGEGPSLNMSDNKKLLELWMEAAKPLDMWVIASVGATPMPITLEMSRYAEQLGVDCIFALPEVFFKPKTPEEYVHYLELIAAVAPETALVIDDIPEDTGVYVDMEEVYDLAKVRVHSFRGIKSNEFTNLLALQDDVEPPYKLYASNHKFLAPEVLMGLKDFVMSDANVFPQLIIDIIFYGQNGYLEETRALYQELVDKIDAITDDDEIDEIAALKEAMTLSTGVDVGPPLPPIVPLTDDEKASIRQALIDNDIPIVYEDDDYN